MIVVVTNSIQPAFTGISSFFFVTDQNITLTIGLEHGTSSTDLLVRILCPENLQQAWLRVKANGGAAGADGMTIAQFPAFARQYLQEIRSRHLAGTYHPAPVRRAFIPQPNGDLRPLGIPTGLERVIQPAIAQMLTPLFDPHLSTHSYGFLEILLTASVEWADVAGISGSFP